MNKLGRRLRDLRTAANLSQLELAKRIGKSKSSVNMYERGEREPGLETLEAIADLFNVDMDYLLGKTDIRNRAPITDYINSLPANVIPIPQMKKVPLLGDIACGEPILAEENIVDFVNMPVAFPGTFALRCHGDSMINARIFDGDLVYIHQQPVVENGEIAAVLIDNEATLKRVYRYPDRIELRAENPTFRTITFVGEEMASVSILGKAIVFTSFVR